MAGDVIANIRIGILSALRGYLLLFGGFVLSRSVALVFARRDRDG